MENQQTRIAQNTYICYKIDEQIIPSPTLTIVIKFMLQDFINSSNLPHNQTPTNVIPISSPTFSPILSLTLYNQESWSRVRATLSSHIGLELEFRDEVMQALESRIDYIIANIIDEPSLVVFCVDIRRFNSMLLDGVEVPRIDMVEKDEEFSLEDLEGNCAICLGGFLVNEDGKQVVMDIVKLPCNHVFHEGCILSWLCRNLKCPLCRSCVSL